MQKIKLIALVSLILALCTAVTAAAVKDKKTVDFTLADSTALDNASCRYTQPEKESHREKYVDFSDFTKKSENSNLAIYFREGTNTLGILNKKSGYFWTSLQDDNTENLNDSWKAFADSVISIDYLDSALQTVRYTPTQSDITEIKYSDNGNIIFSLEMSCGIAFDLSLELKENSVNLTLIRKSVKEKADALLQSVWFAPFLGSVYCDEVDGYFFVPDGNGALIRFNKPQKYISPYNERIYGKDASVENLLVANDVFSKRSGDYMTDVMKITVPVFGAVHGVGRNGFLAVVEEGEEYASVYASPAGYVIDYYWGCIRFDYRQAYYTPVNNSGGSIADTQEKPESFNSSVSYYFLDGEDADYSGMALKYREILEEENKLPSGTVKSDNIPMYLNVMASDVKKTFTGKKTVELTNIKQLNAIIDLANNKGINNLTVVYTGWQNGGLSLAKQGTLKLDKSLGSLSSLKSTKEKLESSGGKLYLGINAVTAYDSQIRPQSSAALTIFKKLACKTLSTENKLFTEKYFIKPNKIFDLINKTEKTEWNYSFYELGTSLYGDYTSGDSINRHEVKEKLSKIFTGYKNGIALSNPNVYLLKNTDEYFDTPMSNSQFLFETDSVPFLSIVLKGKVNCYAPYANQAFYSQSSILKMIEYGTYPSFVLMGAENSKIANTTLANYFSLNYKEWSQTVADVYAKVNGALKNVTDAVITKHKVVTDGIVAVTYSNDTVIYINYTSSDYSIENIEIPAQGYSVRRLS